MNSINFSKGELSLCHKGNCVNVRGDVAKTIVFGIATLVVISGLVSMLDSSNYKLCYGSFNNEATIIIKQISKTKSGHNVIRFIENVNWLEN